MKFLTVLVFFALLFYTCNTASGIKREERKVVNYDNMKAVWVSQYDMQKVFVSEGEQREKSDYTDKAEVMIKNIRDFGFNTIILQIRPFGDSFYTSKFYPESCFVTGEYGRKIQYDALSIFIDICHKSKLSIQAWINPMRLMKTNEIEKIPPCPIKDMYERNFLPICGGRFYLDLARNEARQLIIDGATEALEKYDFDGLHMDDYFYPTEEDYFDEQTFALSGGEDVKQFRIQNLNILVKGLYKAVKKVNKDLIFGISPGGNITKFPGMYCADVFEWCKSDGYIDYLTPQIYFGMRHGSCPFEETARKWSDIMKNDRIKLYIGMTLGKAKLGYQNVEDSLAVTDDGKREWIEHKDVIASCFEAMKRNSRIQGFSLFCYSYFFDVLTGEPMESIQAEVEGFAEYINE